jgi:adenylate cyclase
MASTRRLAAILAANVAGYSRLMRADEEGTHKRFKAHFQQLINPKINEHQGRVVKNTGDGALVEFASVVDAVRCAAEIQRGMLDRDTDMPDERRIKLRIGVNLGDVIAEPEDIYGDGVNIAARLEALAEPGGICISGTVYDQIRDRPPYSFDDMGEQSVKNIARPVRVYGLSPEAVADLPASAMPPTSISPPSLAPRLSIVVLPFTNLSDDAGQQYFADGITEDLTTDLSRIADMLVISRNTAFTYRNKLVDTKQIGRELGVRYVLAGSVQRSGNKIRVTAELIDAETDTHLWAGRYDRDRAELFELQDEIVTAIAGAIEPELLKFERERIATRPQKSEDAYELYQRGMFHHYRQNKADNIEAQAYFRRALTVDPQYPQATAALSIALCSAAMRGWAENSDVCFDQAHELAQRAVTLDPRYPNAHFALGLVCMWTRRSERAIAAFREAIKLNPSFAAAHVLLGQMCLYAGRPEEAIERAEKGIRLSPTDPRLSMWLPALAGAHYLLRHYAEAIEAGRRSWSLNRNWPHGLRYVVAGLGQLGRIEEARAALAELKLMDASLEISAGVLSRVYPDPAAVDHIVDGLRKAGFE